MYIDYPPYRIPTQKVLVLEGTETNPEEVVEGAICGGASLNHPEDGRIFYVVFLATPRCIDVMTERALRKAIIGKGSFNQR
jgi:hypothetical protein